MASSQSGRALSCEQPGGVDRERQVGEVHRGLAADLPQQVPSLLARQHRLRRVPPGAAPRWPGTALTSPTPPAAAPHRPRTPVTASRHAGTVGSTPWRWPPSSATAPTPTASDSRITPRARATTVERLRRWRRRRPGSIEPASHPLRGEPALLIVHAPPSRRAGRCPLFGARASSSHPDDVTGEPSCPHDRHVTPSGDVIGDEGRRFRRGLRGRDPLRAARRHRVTA